jgi:hypothetical protein
MFAALRYTLPVLLILAIFTGLTYVVVSTTSRRWFEDDVRLRAELALRGARGALSDQWATGDRRAVEHLLADITTDERIVAAAACRSDGSAFAQTREFPDELSCGRFTTGSLGRGQPRIWNHVDRIASGQVYLTAVPISSATGVPLGVVGLIHDMSYIQKRDAIMRQAAIWLFGLMAAGALLLSTGIARASWRRFRAEVRALVKGEAERPEFQPLMRDVRELAMQLATESRSGEGGRAWTPDRLRLVLHEHVRG